LKEKALIIIALQARRHDFAAGGLKTTRLGLVF